MNESIESIVTEMRERADAMQTHGTTHGVRLAVLEFARRIEAAWKREREEVEADALEVGGIVEAARTAEKSSAVGNAAAMRDALVAMVEAETEGSMKRDDLCGRCLVKMWDRCKHDGSCWVDKVINALSAPARNCDIGTEQERYRRFLTFCNAHVDCVDCPIKAHWTKALSCGILWDQMPYEAEEGGAK